MTKVVFDADRVLVDWFSQIRNYAIKNNLEHQHLDELLKEQRFIKPSELFKVDEVQALLHFKKYNNSDFIRALDYQQKKAVEHVRNISQRAELIVLSCLGVEGVNQKQVENRKDNLTELYGKVFSDFVIINFGESKQDYLEDIQPLMFVDDSEKHIIEGINAGVKLNILYRHNEDLFKYKERGLNAVSCFSEIEKQFNQELKIKTKIKIK